VPLFFVPRLLESPGFFLENSRTWKVLEKHFGPGKSRKNIIENYALRKKFSVRSWTASSWS